MSLFSTPFVGTELDIALHAISFFMLIGTLGISILAFWKLHEMPVEKARKSNKYHQLELITVLTWIGFIVHWVWIVAVVIAFFDFDKFIYRLKSHENSEEEKC